jgi:hypothetical protein
MRSSLPEEPPERVTTAPDSGWLLALTAGVQRGCLHGGSRTENPVARKLGDVAGQHGCLDEKFSLRAPGLGTGTHGVTRAAANVRSNCRHGDSCYGRLASGPGDPVKSGEPDSNAVMSRATGPPLAAGTWLFDVIFPASSPAGTARLTWQDYRLAGKPGPRGPGRRLTPRIANAHSDGTR